MKLKSEIAQNFIIYYRNEEEFRAIANGVFKDECLAFSCTKSNPYILDCGSHIGIASLYFKSRFPDAEIIAFEPDSNNCEIMKRNIKANQLKNITVVNAALAGFKGRVWYYGEIGGDSPDSRGNSIVEEWGNRGTGDMIAVDAVSLKPYINRPVDFLKLDIEGAERGVLYDIEDQLSYVKEMHLELHQTNTDVDNSELLQVISFLQRNGFEVKLSQPELWSFMPERLKSWVDKVNPVFSTLHAVNLSLR